ncbi:YciI family protein [Magnetovibrio sp. PR-2]|uniref:YciI family protein n=1 Tax=Magnetovibrio sp. PR-2 TaxID=3120356 RepID=UPI002FCE1E49
MLYALYCTDKEDHLDVRLDNRADHLEYLKALGDKLIFAGPTFADDEETMNGGVIVIDMDTRADAEAFAKDDPYNRHGLFATVDIRPWKKVFG